MESAVAVQRKGRGDRLWPEQMGSSKWGQSTILDKLTLRYRLQSPDHTLRTPPDHPTRHERRSSRVGLRDRQPTPQDSIHEKIHPALRPRRHPRRHVRLHHRHPRDPERQHPPRHRLHHHDHSRISPFPERAATVAPQLSRQYGQRFRLVAANNRPQEELSLVLLPLRLF